MNILFTASSYWHIDKFHMEYLYALQGMCEELIIGCPNAPENPVPVGEYADIPYRKEMSIRENLPAMKKIRQLVRDHKIDLILTHTTLAAFFTRLALKGMKHRPYVLYIVQGYLFDHETDWKKKLVYLMAEKLVKGQTDMLITMNHEDFDIAGEYGLGRNLDTVPGMGVDFSGFERSAPEEAAALRDRFGIPRDAFCLIYAAEFSKRKSQKLLIDAMEFLPENVYLALVGGGVMEQECKDYAAAKGLSDRVRFPGFYSEMAPVYSIADAGVSVSRSEGLPFNVMECLHLGLPFVASRVKGHTDLIENGRNGLLFDYGDTDALVSRIRMLLDDPGVRSWLSSNARASVEKYSMENVFPVVMGKYQEAMKRVGERKL